MTGEPQSRLTLFGQALSQLGCALMLLPVVALLLVFAFFVIRGPSASDKRTPTPYPTITDIQESSAWPHDTLCNDWAKVRTGQDVTVNLNYLKKNADAAATFDAKWKPWNEAVLKIADDIDRHDTTGLRRDGAVLTGFCR